MVPALALILMLILILTLTLTRVSRATEGVRFFLACQVVFNHVGLQSPGPGDRMPDDPVQPDESWGAFGQARFMCIHVPTFFALAGFGMSASMGPAPKSKIGFIAVRRGSFNPNPNPNLNPNPNPNPNPRRGCRRCVSHTGLEP